MTRQAGAGADALARFKVVEIASTFAGSQGGRLLAEAGLSVLRIETGEPPLATMPPHLPDGTGTAWASAAGKKAVVRVDPQRHADLIDGLIRASDVFITDRGRYSRHSSGGVTCYIEPPMAGAFPDMPTFDVLAQTVSGAVSVTGRLTGPPVTIGFPVGDVAPGIYAAIGVLNALVEDRRERIVVRPTDATLSTLSYMGCCYKVDGDDIGFIGSGHPYIVPYGAFSASDGYIIVAAFTQVFWRKLCAMLDRNDLAANPRFKTFSDRRDNRDELNALINEIFSHRTVAEWAARLREADVPHAPVHTLRDALAQPVVTAREMVVDVGGHRMLNSPIVDLVRRASGAPGRPVPNTDWRGMLEGLGVAPADIDRMLGAGTLAPMQSAADTRAA